MFKISDTRVSWLLDVILTSTIPSSELIIIKSIFSSSYSGDHCTSYNDFTSSDTTFIWIFSIKENGQTTGHLFSNNEA